MHGVCVCSFLAVCKCVFVHRGGREYIAIYLTQSVVYVLTTLPLNANMETHRINLNETKILRSAATVAVAK